MEPRKTKYKYTLGMDPSGAFKEGKGTTGWCVLDNKTNEVIEIGTIAAKEYTNAHLFWQAHIDLIKRMCRHYHKSWALSIEDYILYKNYAMSQVNSQMETVQLLGIIKQYCFLHNIPYFMRPAVAVKTRWTDTILLHKGLIQQRGTRTFVKCKSKALCDHERDSIRHAVHFNTFENKGGLVCKDLL